VTDPGIGVIPNYPIFLLVLPGILLTTSRRWWPLHIQIAALVVPYTLIVCSFTFWDGGWHRPHDSPRSYCRLLSGMSRWPYRRAPRWLIVRAFAVAAAIYAGTLTTLAIFTPHGGFSTGAAQRPGLPPMFTAWAAQPSASPQPYGCSVGDSNYRESPTTA